MWDHVRLMRSTLLLVSLLTLIGLHQQQDQLSAGWRAASLLPLLSCFLFATANTAKTIIDTDSASEMLYSLTMGMFTYHTLVLLPYLLYHRRRMHDLLRQVAALEEATALQRRPGDHTVIKVRYGLTCCTLLGGGLLGTVSFFFQGNPSHSSNYVIPSMVPPQLQGPSWYWAITSLQIMFIILITLVTITFELILFGLSDALALFHSRLVRYCREYLNGNVEREVHRHGGALEQPLHDADEPQSAGILLDQDVNGGNLPGGGRRANRMGQVVPWTTDGNKSEKPRIDTDLYRHTSWGSSASRPTESRDIEYRINHLKKTYLSVRRLGMSAASLCSVPLFSLYTCATVNLLLHSYISIVLFSKSAGKSDRRSFFVAGSMVAMLRLLAVSSSGSWLLLHGQQLHQTLSEVSCPTHLSTAARFSLQLLLEQTRHPLAFDAWGLFTIQKGNMLSLLSFVLTYFVIMLQMNVK